MDFPVADFAVALALGALVGMEREKRKGVTGFGGLRTFILVAEAGALAAWISMRLDAPWVFAGTGVAIAGLTVAGYVLQAHQDPATRGLTTEVAAVVVYLLGGTVLYGGREIAVALAIVTSAILAFKEPLHGAVARLGDRDIFAVLKLLLATFVVLPLLPDREVDPWDAINPHKLWWLVILVSGISLVGYAATRMIGPGKGIPIAGAVGGMASSTAVTLSFARRCREGGEQEKLAGLYAAGILLAWTVMFVRVLATVAIVEPGLIRHLVWPLASMGAACGVVSFGSARRAGDSANDKSVELRNPFTFVPAIKFALLFAAILVAVKLVKSRLPEQGIYLVAGVSGLVDVDAITLSMADGVRSGQDPSSAAMAIEIAVLTNTLAKCGMVAALGEKRIRNRILVATVAVVAAGVLAVIVS